MISSGEKKLVSAIKPKTLNPVWHEELVMKGTLLEFVRSGLSFVINDADHPMPRLDKDDIIGEVSDRGGPTREPSRLTLVARRRSASRCE